MSVLKRIMHPFTHKTVRDSDAEQDPILDIDKIEAWLLEIGPSKTIFMDGMTPQELGRHVCHTMIRLGVNPRRYTGSGRALAWWLAMKEDPEELLP